MGHGIGDSCSNPEPSYDDNFTVIDVKGIHLIHLDYCGCETAQARHIQLLRMSWYPATTSAPRTAATFRVLEHFQLLTFESKASGFAIYNALARSTDNTGTATPPVCCLHSPSCIHLLMSAAGQLSRFHADDAGMAPHQITEARRPRTSARRTGPLKRKTG